MKFKHLLFLLLCSFKLSASHIAGGEIYYDFLGGTNYRITLKVYHDCLNGQVNLDGLATPGSTLIVDPTITVFNGSGNYVTQYLLLPPTVNNVPSSINNPCITSPNIVCIDEGVYTATVSLPPQIGGYYIVYQRAARNAATLNIINPIGSGATFWEHIPGTELTSTNSSPRFTNLPPLYVCEGIPINFNHSATDPDGDVLVYSLASPFEGLGGCCGYVPVGGANPPLGTQCGPYCPPLNGPPFTPLTFILPYNGNYPMSSSPPISINSSSGLLNGSPNISGQWVVGIKVQEYRNNILIGTHFRDYEFNVVPCIVPVLSSILTPTSLCNGNPINFINQSIGGITYHWDFGVNSLLNDTSNLKNPTYMFPDTGKYIVTLIVNPGTPCVDTSRQIFYVYPKLAPTFTAPSPQCVTYNSFNFNIGGSFASYCTFNWQFGINASPPNSSVMSPTNVVYNSPGIFPVKIIIKEAVCTKTLVDTVKVYPKPVIKFDSTVFVLCDPAIITFTNLTSTNFPTTFNWQFSDGGSSGIKNPTHVFSPSGVYNVTVTTITNNGCVDTCTIKLNGMITVQPTPTAGFSFLPTSTTIFDPDIYFFDESLSSISWYYDFGDGESSNMVNPSHQYLNFGDFSVVQIVTNNYGCTDTVLKTVKILPEFRFWVPNSFTPKNKDGLNDEFIPVTFGVTNYEFYMFDRWGNQIFKTDQPNQGWNGTFEGQPCEQGTYHWLINFKNVVTLRTEQHTGSCFLLK